MTLKLFDFANAIKEANSMSIEEYRRLGQVHRGGKRNANSLEKPIRNDEEHLEQCTVIDYCNLKGIMVMAIPNGGNKGKATAGRMKAEGLRKGAPDLFFPIARGGHHGLFIEMKAHNGVLKPEQKQWLLDLTINGYKTHVAWSAQEAIDFINVYLA